MISRTPAIQAPRKPYDYELFVVTNREGQTIGTISGLRASKIRCIVSSPSFLHSYITIDSPPDLVVPLRRQGDVCDTRRGAWCLRAGLYSSPLRQAASNDKPHIMPTYTLARVSEAVREREALVAKARAENEQAQAQARAQEREVDDDLHATVGA